MVEQKARPPPRPRLCCLNSLQILGSRLAGLAVHHDLERNALAFPQFTQACALDRTDMDEHILATAFGLNESEDENPRRHRRKFTGAARKTTCL